MLHTGYSRMLLYCIGQLWVQNAAGSKHVGRMPAVVVLMVAVSVREAFAAS